MVLLSFLLCLLLFAPLYFGSSGISTVSRTHCPLLCQASHAFGSFWFGSFRFGGFWFGGFRFDSFRFDGFRFCIFQFLSGLAIPVDRFGFSGGWCNDFEVAGLLVSGLVGGGFGGSGFWGIGSCWVQAASGTLYQCCWTHQCHWDCRIQHCHTQCGEVVGLSSAVSRRCDHLLFLRIN